MFRIDDATAATSLPTPEATGTEGFFTEGTPGVTPATLVRGSFLNMVQEELRAVVVAGGLTPSKTVYTQVRDAILKIACLPAGFINGLTLANNGTSPTTQVDIAAGRARDFGNAFDLVFSGMTKTLQASGAWAAGTSQNGLFSGAKANSTWYHVFLIRRTADGSIDAGFDTSITAANIPAGYAGYRRLGSIKTDASGNIIGFVQFRDEFWWNAAILDVASTTLGITATNFTISTPPGISTVADLMIFAGGNATTDSNVLVHSPLGTDVAPPAVAAIPSASPATVANIMALAGDAGSGTHARMLTNTSSQITARSANTNSVIYVWNRGYRDQI